MASLSGTRNPATTEASDRLRVLLPERLPAAGAHTEPGEGGGLVAPGGGLGWWVGGWEGTTMDQPAVLMRAGGREPI